MIFVFLFSFPAFGQRLSSQVELIRKIYTEVNSQIAEMQKQPELSSVFAVELTVNKHSAPYPAVGIYQRTATFYYTYGEREKNPYPNRLLKITAVYKRSARTENAEFYFNPAGQLVFAFMTNPESAIKETRLYFAAGRLIKMTEDQQEINLKRQRALEAGTLTKKEAARLASVFRLALIDNN